MDPAGEDEVEFPGDHASVDRTHRQVDRLLPEDQAGTGPDVPATLAPFEDEPTRAFLEELGQQPGRRDVDIRRDPLPLQLPGLVRPAAGDQGEGGPGPEDRRLLLGAELGRDEPKQADAPGATGQGLRRIVQ